MPKVKAVYEKFHEKGFEIVGLSYDEERQTLQQLSRQRASRGRRIRRSQRGKEVCREFGVTSLPTMWLLDKNGVLRDLQGVNDLDKKVEKLLAAK